MDYLKTTGHLYVKFEEVADEIDKKDSELGGDEGKRFRKYGRPYLVASGIENGIKFIFTMSPYMSKVASRLFTV